MVSPGGHGGRGARLRWCGTSCCSGGHDDAGRLWINIARAVACNGPRRCQAALFGAGLGIARVSQLQRPSACRRSWTLVRNNRGNLPLQARRKLPESFICTRTDRRPLLIRARSEGRSTTPSGLGGANTTSISQMRLSTEKPARPIPTWFFRTDRPRCLPPSLEPCIDLSLGR